MTFGCVLLTVATVLAGLTARVASSKRVNNKTLNELQDLKNLLEKFRLKYEEELSSTTMDSTTVTLWTDTTTIPLNTATPSNVTETTTPLPNVTETETATTPLSAITPQSTTKSRTTVEPPANKTEGNSTRSQPSPLHNVVPSQFRGLNLYSKPGSPCFCGDNAEKRITGGQLLIVPNSEYDAADDA